MLNVLHWISEDEKGAAAIEYGLIACLVSVAGITALGLMGGSLASLLDLAVGALQLPECRARPRQRAR